MTVEKRLLQAFIRWLKENDVYDLFRYNTAHYSDSICYSVPKFLKGLKTQARNTNDFSRKFTNLIYVAPFTWHAQYSQTNDDVPVLTRIRQGEVAPNEEYLWACLASWAEIHPSFIKIFCEHV